MNEAVYDRSVDPNSGPLWICSQISFFSGGSAPDRVLALHLPSQERSYFQLMGPNQTHRGTLTLLFRRLQRRTSRQTPLCRQPGTPVHMIKSGGQHTKCACDYVPSPSEINGQSSMEVSKATPETSSSGRFSGSVRPAHRPLANIHDLGRMISASTMPPSLPSAVIDILAHDA